MPYTCMWPFRFLGIHKSFQNSLWVSHLQFSSEVFFFFWSACCLPQLLLTPQGAVGFPGGKAVENPPGNAEEMRRKWQPTPVFVSGKVHGQRSLAGYSPWCFKESDTISVCARAHTHTHTHTHGAVMFNNCWLLLTNQSGRRLLMHWVSSESGQLKTRLASGVF